MALTAEQLIALAADPAFRYRIRLAISELCYAAIAEERETDDQEPDYMTDKEYTKYLKRALRLITEPEVQAKYAERIATTVIGAPAVVAATELDGSDIADVDLALAVQAVALGINAYEDLTGEVVI